MDNNKPIEPQPKPTIVQPASGGGSNKMFLWLVIGIFVIGLIAVAYFYMQGQKSNSGYQVPGAASQKAVPETSLDNDLNSVDVQASGDADFNALDKDLQNL